MDSKEYEELRKKFPFEFDKLTVKFNPKLSETERKFVNDILDIGQRIEDRESLKKILHHIFFKKGIVTNNFNENSPVVADV